MAPFAFQSHMLGFGSRMTESSLQSSLKKATEATSIDVPKDACLAIVQASHQPDDRRAIMRHVATCLCEAAGAKWRRVYLAIGLLDELLKRSTPELLTEIADGAHFDIVQRMSFLEKFEYDVDLRVQNLVRQKAQSVCKTYLELQQHPERHQASVTGESKGNARRNQKMTHMMAYTTHSEDTTDDESSGEEEIRQTRKIAHSKVSGQPDQKTADESSASSTDGESETSCNSSSASKACSARSGLVSDLLCDDALDCPSTPGVNALDCPSTPGSDDLLALDACEAFESRQASRGLTTSAMAGADDLLALEACEAFEVRHASRGQIAPSTVAGTDDMLTLDMSEPSRTQQEASSLCLPVVVQSADDLLDL